MVMAFLTAGDAEVFAQIPAIHRAVNVFVAPARELSNHACGMM